MSMSSQYIQPVNTALQLQGKKLSIRGAIVGSVVFAIADLVGIYINTYLLKIETTLDAIAITVSIGWVIFLVLFGSATTYFPASHLGTFLAKTLEKDFIENRFSQKSAIMKGGVIGAIAVLLVCIPLLSLNFIFVLSTGHGDFFVMLYRAGVATVIALFAGAWIGNKLGKQLVQ